MHGAVGRFNLAIVSQERGEGKKKSLVTSKGKEGREVKVVQQPTLVLLVYTGPQYKKEPGHGETAKYATGAHSKTFGERTGDRGGWTWRKRKASSRFQFKEIGKNRTRKNTVTSPERAGGET